MDVVIWLGGNWRRGYHAVELASKLLNAKLLISSEGSPDACWKIIDDAGLPRDQVIWDQIAWDTVTNFTLTYRLVKHLNPSRLIVVTDGFHMRRSMAIAKAVYWLRGIKVVPSPGSPAEHQEPNRLVREDFLRALLWRLTGFQHIWKEVYQKRTGRTAPGTFVRIG